MPPGPPVHMHASAVTPVASATLKKNYLPVAMVVHYIFCNLDSFEVLYTTGAFHGYRSYMQEILAWKQAYIKKLQLASMGRLV